MKKNKRIKQALTIAIMSLLGHGLNAQCTISGLDANYCSDGVISTLIGSPSGGVFTGDGISGNSFNPITAGSGNHTIDYKVTFGDNKYYIKSNVGNPWGNTANQTSMNLAFGVGNWIQAEFETLDPSVIFSEHTSFVFIDGSDDAAIELGTFLNTNITAIEAWVDQGGRLFLNAAPNEGGDIDFGFGGTTLSYNTPCASVTVIDPNHATLLGPNTPTSVSMTGSSFSHAHIIGSGYTSIVTKQSDASIKVLAEKNWGKGVVFMGGMVTPNFQNPSPEAQNWRANILVYMHAATTRYYVISSVSGEPWGSYSNRETMNSAFSASGWTAEFFESLDINRVFSKNTSFVFLEGSDANANMLNTFITANMNVIENWVYNGGSLLINAAPNYGGDINVGFNGTTIVYNNSASSVDVTNLSHPIYLGPITPLATTMTGSSYSHAHITGNNLVTILNETGDINNIILSEKPWGDGNVMFGGMTTANYHSPTPEAQNWRANMYSHLDELFDGNTCSTSIVTNVYTPIDITYLVTDETLGADGEIDISVSGGALLYTFDWDNDGTGDFDDLDDLTNLTAGSYTLVVQDQFGCQGTETINIQSQVGIIENIEQISIYPNPVTDMLTIEFDGNFKYQVSSINGNAIFNGQAVKKQVVDFSELASGVYFIQINSNGRSKTIKVFKK